MPEESNRKPATELGNGCRVKKCDCVQNCRAWHVVNLNDEVICVTQDMKTAELVAGAIKFWIVNGRGW